MPKVYAKTLVSSPNELPFVMMNICELEGVVDEFLVCESNITHTGEIRNFDFLDDFALKLENMSNKVRIVRMNLEDRTENWNGESLILHKNEQEIRNGFQKYIDLDPDDIVISMDGDEVLHGNRVKKFIRYLERPYHARTSYLLRLHVVIYKISYNWVNCNFQAPVVCRASHFMFDEAPQWRYSGTRTFFKSGTHFTWLMTPIDMVSKILRYSHRKENEIFANLELLQSAVSQKTYPFEKARPFRIITKPIESRIYPKSLRKFISMFDTALR